MGELLGLLQEVDERVRTVLLIGHEPAISAVGSFVAGADGDSAHLTQIRSGLPTGTCAVLETAGTWSQLGPSCARLVDVVRPPR
jgi:phosphohistidine phosphatase